MTTTALIPETDKGEIEALQATLLQSREATAVADEMTKAFATAKAMRKIEAAITPNLMADVRQLMNSPTGFKTDRRPGMKDKQGHKIEPYSDQTVKRCLIVAFMKGAKLLGNEFNIIAGQCYLTKEFYVRKIKESANCLRFEHKIGNPLRHDGNAFMDAEASWVDAEGELHEVTYFDNRSEGGKDYRIVVNCYSTSGTDQLIGLAESKLFRRIYNLMSGEDIEDSESDVVPGAVTKRVDSTPVNEPAPASESAPPSEPGSNGGQHAATSPKFKSQVDELRYRFETCTDKAAVNTLSTKLQGPGMDFDTELVKQVAANRRKELS